MRKVKMKNNNNSINKNNNNWKICSYVYQQKDKSHEIMTFGFYFLKIQE